MWTTCSKNSLSRSKSLAKVFSFTARRPLPARFQILELQTLFAGGFRKDLDVAVVDVAAAVEDDLLDPLLLGALGDHLADHFRRVLVASRAGEPLPDVRIGGARLGESVAADVVDHLG